MHRSYHISNLSNWMTTRLSELWWVLIYLATMSSIWKHCRTDQCKISHLFFTVLFLCHIYSAMRFLHNNQNMCWTKTLVCAEKTPYLKKNRIKKRFCAWELENSKKTVPLYLFFTKNTKHKKKIKRSAIWFSHRLDLCLGQCSWFYHSAWACASNVVRQMPGRRDRDDHRRTSQMFRWLQRHPGEAYRRFSRTRTAGTESGCTVESSGMPQVFF